MTNIIFGRDVRPHINVGGSDVIWSVVGGLYAAIESPCLESIPLHNVEDIRINGHWFKRNIDPIECHKLDALVHKETISKFTTGTP